MKESDRINLGHGVALYRRFLTWWLDVHRGGARVQRSLKTRDRGVALKIGGSVVDQIEKDVHKIKSLESIINSCAVVLSEPKDDTLRAQMLAAIQGEATSSLAALARQGFDLRELVKDAIRSELGTSKPAPVTWDQAEADYVKALEGARRNARYIRETRAKLIEFKGFSKVVNLGDVTPTHVSNYMAEVKGADATVRGRFRAVYGFLEWARASKLLRENPAEDVKRPEVAEIDVTYLTRDQAIQRLEKIKGHRLETLLGVALYTGLRRGELARLSAEDIDIPGRNIRVRNKAEGNVKTKSNRNVPILDQALPYLMRLPKEGAAFAGVGSWARASDESNKLGIGLQLCRHTAVTHWLLNGVSPHVAARWAGHDVKVQQDRYAGYRPGDQPLPMSYHGKKLAAHGLPDVSTLAKKAGGV